MTAYKYPLHFKFRVTTFSNDFVATDADGATLFYVREKIFKWRDHISVYRDESKSELLYEFISNKLIDFQQTLTIYDHQNRVVGKVRRKSIKSLWRSTFYLMDQDDRHDHSITEKNVWTKFWDSMFGELPLIGMLSGYVFNPSYLLKDQQGNVLFEIVKEPSFFGRKFTLYKETDQPVDDERMVLSLMLMILAERTNG